MLGPPAGQPYLWRSPLGSVSLSFPDGRFPARAEVLSVSVPRVHQLKAQALDKLRAALGDEFDVL